MGRRSATPTRATPSVTSAASSKISVWLPRSMRFSNPRAAGPISTPAMRAIKGSETGVRSLRRPRASRATVEQPSDGRQGYVQHVQDRTPRA